MSDFINKYINYASYENTEFRVHAQVCRERKICMTYLKLIVAKQVSF